MLLFYRISLIIALLPRGVEAHPVYYSFFILSRPELLGPEPFKQRTISSTAVATSAGGDNVISGNVTSTTEGHQVLSIELACLRSALCDSAVAALPTEVEHRVAPVLQSILDCTTIVSDLLLAHELAVLELVPLH